MNDEKILKYPELTQKACIIDAENPKLVKLELDCFYLDHPVPQAQEMLDKMYQGWLKYRAILGADTDCDHLEDMYFYYYRLNCLLVAAYVTMKEGKETTKVVLDDVIGLKKCHPAVSTELAPAIELLIRVIQPEKAFLWKKQHSNSSLNEEIEVLFVLQDRLQQKFADLQPQLDFIHAAQSHLHCSLCVNGALVEAFKTCDLLYLSHCRPENLIYDLSGKPMPKVSSIDLLERKAKSENVFRWTIQLADSFYVQSQDCLEDSPRLAAFLLHQCAEHSCRALITAFRGKEKKTHDLFALNKELKQIAPEMCMVFPVEDIEGQRLLELLNLTYCQSRYQEDFVVSRDDLKILSERVSKLPKLAKTAFNKMMLLLDVAE
ncbi:HEPN domain-containing protein [Pedobacter glucosidilyticus]|uniref:HEPN domain-containing protein n=1 Tax=Pedobacter glucosidilyticus TaxID=1122941 RepID=UPI0004204E15|nr:HEPN domain-containing protein [Pedobacter glucosidilyticus]